MNKKKKIIILVVTVLVLIIATGIYLYPKEIHMPTWMTYPYDVTIEEGYATINKYLSDETEVNIPKRFFLAEVHTIEGDAFERLGTDVFIKSVPESVTLGLRLYHQGSQSYYSLRSNEKIILLEYVGNERKVEIPEEVWGRKVTDIYDAFRDSEIDEVIIPETVTSISRSFIGCRNLKKITLPDKLVKIGRITFSGSGIENIELPESVEIIDSGAFAYSELKEIKGLENIKYIGNDPFRGTPWEENIGGDFVCLGDLLLLYRGEDEEVVVPLNVKEIRGAFLREEEYSYPLKVRKVFIPDSVKVISAYSFGGQEGIEVYIPETVELIGDDSSHTDTIFGLYDEVPGIIVTTEGSPAEAYAIEEGVSYRIISSEDMQQEMGAAKKQQENNQTPMTETLVTENNNEKEEVESLLWSYYKNYVLYGDENSEILGIQTNLIGDVSLLMADGCYKELSESLAEENKTNRMNGSPVDGVRKVSVHRADQKILSLLKVNCDDYGEVSYISHTYDVASGRKLKLADLVKDMDIFRGLVEEQLQENELQEEELEVWTAGYEGLTIYLQTEKSKANPVMISYKEHPELYKEDMSQELSGFMVGFDPYSDLIFDVDEDGKSDLIKMELRENSEIVVQVGDQSVICQQKAYDDGDDCFVGGYFVKNDDGKKYILIYTNTDWDYCNSYSVIQLEEAEPIYVGDGIFNFDMAHALTDPAKIMDKAESRIQTEGIAYDTCWAHVNSEGYLELLEEIYYCGEIYAASESIRGKQVDVDGTAQDNTIEIPEGEKVLLFRTDYQEYKDYILADGRICRVNLSESEAASFGVEEKGEVSK